MLIGKKSPPVFLAAALCFLVSFRATSTAQDSIELASIPAKFDEWQDDSGFTWQVNKNGGLGSGNAPYFQNTLGLFINGGQFSPQSGTLLDNEPIKTLSLTGESGSINIQRDLLFDEVRSGVRVLDVFENPSDQPAKLRIDYKTAYQYPWQDLHGTDGKILTAGSAMSDRDFGVVVKFSQSEGRHDTLFVTSSEKGAVRPNVTFSSNLRELTFTYNLEIPPGESTALLHWVAQRNLQAASDAEENLRPFFSRRMLVESRLSEQQKSLVLNFSPDAFPSEGATPFDPEALVTLNRLIEPTGATRSNQDILWISQENQLSGTVNESATIEVDARFGKQNIPIQQIAAIRGGGGLGRTPAVFLRNGEVAVGPVTTSNLSMQIAEGWDVEELEIEELELLLMRIAESDGKPPGDTAVYAELRTGDVIAISADGATSTSIETLSPWGAHEVAVSEILDLHYSTLSGAPKFRVTRTDGSILTVFLAGKSLSLNNREFDTADIASIWQRKTSVTPLSEPNDEWLEFGDIGPITDLPVESCLLRGNNLLAGSISMPELNLVAGSTVTRIDPAEIDRIRLSEETITEMLPVFEFELSGGELLTGRIRERTLIIKAPDNREWRIPTQHFVGFFRQNQEANL